MNDYYRHDELCLPKSGIFHLGELATTYTVSQLGSRNSLGRNFHYVANGTGHALNLAGGNGQALKIVRHAEKLGLAFPARHRVQITNENAGSRYPGHYVLLDVSGYEKPQRKAIIFIVHEGSVFQNYKSNGCKTDADVIREFIQLAETAAKEGDFYPKPTPAEVHELRERLMATT